MKTQRVLITGGAGFIGSHLAALLLSEGRSVRILDNFSTGDYSNIRLLPERCDIVEGDIRDLEICRKACQDVDSVFHLAAIASVAGSISDPQKNHDVNINGTLNMLLAARDSRARRFVFSSSAAVYGNSETVPTQESQPLYPQSPYATSKACGEFYCRNFYELYGLETVMLRYFNVFGPRQNMKSGYSAVIPSFINAIVANEKPMIYGDGTQTRDFVYVENIARANMLASEADHASGEVFNIGSGQAISLLDLLSCLEQITERRSMAEFYTGRPGEVRHSRADISKAVGILGYGSTVSLSCGLQNTLESMQRSCVLAGAR